MQKDGFCQNFRIVFSIHLQWRMSKDRRRGTYNRHLGSCPQLHRQHKRSWGAGGQPFIGFYLASSFELPFPLPSLLLCCMCLFSYPCSFATEDELKIQFENSGKKTSFCILAQFLHNEISHHIMFTTCACDDVERK